MTLSLTAPAAEHWPAWKIGSIFGVADEAHRQRLNARFAALSRVFPAPDFQEELAGEAYWTDCTPEECVRAYVERRYTRPLHAGRLRDGAKYFGIKGHSVKPRPQLAAEILAAALAKLSTEPQEPRT